MPPARILIVDDEPSVRYILQQSLLSEGYCIDCVEDGLQALTAIQRETYDLILLDYRMEPMDGVEVLRSVRAIDSDIIVILLTAHSTIDSAVQALRLGAFDYLYKPASPDAIRRRVSEGLAQRAQAIRRRKLLDQVEHLRQALSSIEETDLPAPATSANRRFTQSGALIVDHNHRTATLAGRLLDLTTTEFDLLVCLVLASPNPVSPSQLVSAGLSYQCPENEAREIIKSHIHHLRQKVEPDPSNPRYIKTQRYRGYFWTGA